MFHHAIIIARIIEGSLRTYVLAALALWLSLTSHMDLLFINRMHGGVQGPYQEIQAQGFSYSPSLRGLFGNPRACISWYGTSTQLVNSLLHDPF